MGHNGSWVFRNASDPRNASGTAAADANRSSLGEFVEAQLYRQFTTTVQVVIFIGSLLGKPSAWAPSRGFASGARAPISCSLYGRVRIVEGGVRTPG